MCGEKHQDGSGNCGGCHALRGGKECHAITLRPDILESTNH
jgi:hypothetical protein